MTPLEELYELPEELRVRAEDIPPDLAEDIAYLLDCNAMLDMGQSVPTIQEWRLARAH
jgi:hypothetical protein